MVTITVSAAYGDIFSRALRNSHISFLYEIRHDEKLEMQIASFTLKEEDLRQATEIIKETRKDIRIWNTHSTQTIRQK